MIHIGQKNKLRAVRDTSVGVFLSDNEGNELLLPNKYVPENLYENQEIEVFVYKDSEDRPIATNLEPYAQVGQFASLKVVELTKIGAFLDMGLEKHLLVPYREQPIRLREGHWAVVYVGLDTQTERLFGSCKINKYLTHENPDLNVGQAVEILITERTDLGFNAIINHQYRGLLYANEIFQRLYVGEVLTAYVKNLRPDHRIDLTLRQAGYAHVEPNVARIMTYLQENDGYLPLTDKSDPNEIYRLLEMSKKTFKQAIGSLYKAQKIKLEAEGARLL